MRILGYLTVGLLFCTLDLPAANAGDTTLTIETPMPPPAWALLERELLRANAAACEEFFNRYFDERGYLLCVERWGGDDGPDDAIENCNDWPILHALGASDSVQRLYHKAWEGHLRQYTAAKTTHVPFARDGMYYKEFPVMFDWVHNGEGLTVFDLMGLSAPDDRLFRQRVQRFAGLYLNEDPGAQNYDYEHKIIRSLFTGSRGPLLRKATAVDWAGDPIEVQGRFRLGHGEDSYEQMLEHFKDYNDVIGDHPLNLLSTSLVMNAWMLTQDNKYRKWVLDYVDAWRERMVANNHLIPSNIGLDGKIGGACDGKWYGGVYGWAFSVATPGSGKIVHRNRHYDGFIGFMNAYLLTGDDRYLDVWRKQIDTVNAQRKTVDGQTVYPHMFGDQGWYDFKPQKYAPFDLELYYLSMRPVDRDRLPVGHGWLSYLEGKNPGYPVAALTSDFSRIRSRVEGFRNDTTTPDTRLSDDPLKYNPASVTSLIQLMLGGVHPGRNGSLLQCRVRYFDPLRRRAGLPEDVGALVETLTADSLTLTLVNTSQLESRTVVVQSGAYAEHQFADVSIDKSASPPMPINDTSLTIRLSPGCGCRLVIKNKRYANPPTLAFPWQRRKPAP